MKSFDFQINFLKNVMAGGLLKIIAIRSGYSLRQSGSLAEGHTGGFELAAFCYMYLWYLRVVRRAKYLFMRNLFRIAINFTLAAHLFSLKC